MRHPAFLLSAILPLALAACGQAVPVGQTDTDPAAVPSNVVDMQRTVPDPETSPSEVSVDDCHAKIASGYIGREADAVTRAKLLTDISPITDVRWLSAGEKISEDEIVPHRLDVQLDENSKIQSVSCG